MRLLVTGFEPFGGDSENAALAAVDRLAVGWSGARMTTAVLPVSFAAAPITLRDLVERHRPDAVLAVGEAGGRTAVTPESRARNVMHARIPDNVGDRPTAAPIDAGPEWIDLPYRPAGAVAAIRAAGVPAHVSHDAGTFVCNRIARQVATLGIPGGFVHIPAIRSRGRARVGAETDPDAVTDGRPTPLSIDEVAVALRLCLDALLDDR
ncbi:pyroglutamyl-peptidase I family protein [Millisia brevis]|uniref:pyroglutamyl-peptidase I family protein n=1 Tax=Millisia brevis TaxID=264148 RepID=UPI00082CA9C8|nr:hypothetical protein [Millisia brevis]